MQNGVICYSYHAACDAPGHSALIPGSSYVLTAFPRLPTPTQVDSFRKGSGSGLAASRVVLADGVAVGWPAEKGSVGGRVAPDSRIHRGTRRRSPPPPLVSSFRPLTVTRQSCRPGLSLSHCVWDDHPTSQLGVGEDHMAGVRQAWQLRKCSGLSG